MREQIQYEKKYIYMRHWSTGLNGRGSTPPDPGASTISRPRNPRRDPTTLRSGMRLCNFCGMRAFENI